jgi:hypothetical protein
MRGRVGSPTQALVPRQSVEKGRQKSIFSWALQLSKVETVCEHGFEAIYSLHHSGVVGEGGRPNSGVKLIMTLHMVGLMGDTYDIPHGRVDR